MRRTVAELGGEFGGVKFLKEWPDYFPHVQTADLNANFHQQLDKLQGKCAEHPDFPMSFAKS